MEKYNAFVILFNGEAGKQYEVFRPKTDMTIEQVAEAFIGVNPHLKNIGVVPMNSVSTFEK